MFNQYLFIFKRFLTDFATERFVFVMRQHMGFEILFAPGDVETNLACQVGTTEMGLETLFVRELLFAFITGPVGAIEFSRFISLLAWLVNVCGNVLVQVGLTAGNVPAYAAR